MLPCPTCNNVREPVCNRGNPVTCYSVTGTGNGAACHDKKIPAEVIVEPAKKRCVIKNFSSNRIFQPKISNAIKSSGC